MHKNLFVLFCLLCLFSFSHSQTNETNQKKYWKFRNDFVENFVKIGPSQGESLPAGRRKPCYSVDNINYSGTCFGEMHWGDGFIRQGHYLGFLATEYALLQRNGQDTKGVLNELYYAIEAVNRLDKKAEPLNSSIYGLTLPENLDGYYLREDIPEDFCLNWQDGIWDMRGTNSPHYHNNNAAKVHDPANGLFVKDSSYQNAPSLDQMTGILVGFRVVHKLVDNQFVQPRPSDTGFFILDEVAAITDRLVRFAADHNWQLIDMNGWPVANGGGDLALTGYPIELAAVEITGNSFLQNVRRQPVGYGAIQQCITGYGVDDNDPQAQQDACNSITGFLELQALAALQTGVPPGPNNNQNTSVFQSWQNAGFIQTNLGATSSLWQNDLAQGNIPVSLAEYNNTILFNCGVMSGLWNPSQVNNWGNNTENQQLELVNAVLRDENPFSSQSYYKGFLDSMDLNGPFFLIGRDYPPTSKDSLFHSDGWSSEYRWTNPQQASGIVIDQFQGIYSALDYMYFHNLYYLLFESTLPPFVEDVDCFCNATIQKPYDGSANVDANNSLNRRLDYLETCNPNVFEVVSNHVSTDFDIAPYFSQYIDIAIQPVQFQTEDAFVHNPAKLNILTDLVICNGKTLQVENLSQLIVENGDLVAKASSILDVSGDLIVKKGSKVWVQDLAKVVFHAQSRLIVEDEGIFNLNEGAILEFHNGAQIIMEGANSEFILGGNVAMVDGGIFRIDHSASLESGRFIVSSANASFTNLSVNAAQVELKGKDKSDDFLILEDNARLLVADFSVSGIDSLNLGKCLIQFGEGSQINCQQPVFVRECGLTSLSNNDGIAVMEQNYFEDCDFADVPIYANLIAENSYPFVARNCLFYSDPAINELHPGLVSVDGYGMDIENCVFQGSQNACIFSENLSIASSVINCELSYCALSSNWFGPLLIGQSEFGVV